MHLKYICIHYVYPNDIHDCNKSNKEHFNDLQEPSCNGGAPQIYFYSRQKYVFVRIYIYCKKVHLSLKDFITLGQPP